MPKLVGLIQLRTNKRKENSEGGEISDEEDNELDTTGSPASC